MDKQPKLTLKELARKALEKRKQKESEIIKTSETTHKNSDLSSRNAHNNFNFIFYKEKLIINTLITLQISS